MLIASIRVGTGAYRMYNFPTSRVRAAIDDVASVRVDADLRTSITIRQEIIDSCFAEIIAPCM